jgi:hypothetical protein
LVLKSLQIYINRGRISLSKEEIEFLNTWTKQIREEEYKEYKKTIDYKEFTDNAEFNKTLILDLYKRCKYGHNYEVEKVLFDYRLKWDYIYKLLFAIFVLSNDNARFELLGYKLENADQIKVLYYLYDYFSDSLYVHHRKLPQLPDIEHIYKPKIDNGSLDVLKSMIRNEREFGYNTNDVHINPQLAYSRLSKVFSECKDELIWYFNDEEIHYLEVIYDKASLYLQENHKLVEDSKESSKTVIDDANTLVGENSMSETVDKKDATVNYSEVNKENKEIYIDKQREKEIFDGIYIKKHETTSGKEMLHFKNKVVKSLRIDALIYSDNNLNAFADNVVSKYNDTFTQTYDKYISPQQLKFAFDCTRLLSGEFKDIKPVLVPAKAGFGKSTFIRTFLEIKIAEGIKKDNSWGAIIVTDRIEDLKELQKYLEDKIGAYRKYTYTNNSGTEKIISVPWIYVLEGWNESICLNNIKQYDERNCTRFNCTHFDNCKVSRQFSEQVNSPIVAMSNARLYNYLSENKLKEFVQWKKVDNIEVKREVLIIDEKPKLENTDDIDMEIISEMIASINEIPQYNETIKSSVRLLKKELLEAQTKITELMSKNIDNRNAIIYENQSSFFSSQFKENWSKYYRFKYRYKINTIETLLTRGGLWCKTQNRMYFKLLEYINFDWSIGINTVIFDATAESDPSYSEIFNYLDINDYKKYEHLQFCVIDDNFSKSALKDKPEKIKAVTDWIKRDIEHKGKTYVVTYMEYSPVVTEQLQGRDRIVFDKKNGKDIVPYFNNTKGKNMWQDCNQMVHIGWNRYPSDEYLASYLSVFGFDALREKYYTYIDNEKACEYLITGYVKQENHDFVVDNIVFHRLCKIVSDFEQEIFRTKLRDFGSDEDVTVYIFMPDARILSMLKQRFLGCKIDKITVPELNVFKLENRKNNEDNKELNLYLWLSSWDGQPKMIKELKQELGISDDYWKDLKKKPMIKDICDSKKVEQVRKGRFYYIIGKA